MNECVTNGFSFHWCNIIYEERRDTRRCTVNKLFVKNVKNLKLNTVKFTLVPAMIFNIFDHFYSLGTA